MGPCLDLYRWSKMEYMTNSNNNWKKIQRKGVQYKSFVVALCRLSLLLHDGLLEYQQEAHDLVVYQCQSSLEIVSTLLSRRVAAQDSPTATILLETIHRLYHIGWLFSDFNKRVILVLQNPLHRSGPLTHFIYV